MYIHVVVYSSGWCVHACILTWTSLRSIIIIRIYIYTCMYYYMYMYMYICTCTCVLNADPASMLTHGAVVMHL